MEFDNLNNKESDLIFIPITINNRYKMERREKNEKRTN